MAGWEISLSEAAQLEAGLRPVPFGLTLLRLISRPSQGDAPRIEGRGVAGIGADLDTNPIPAPCAASILRCTITVKTY
ncbi:hypothetical protein [Puniceicoccus vermicola]|uniref:Uncharacterized protein n=1 Tax=Puniceicoccus vermicola TaxID=388746 RepID=A0A7X1AUQ7_9BACT|nr:hypothetical protein [Puniceicoccus vermicola]MBC2600370.1 hypothetical protein [Puniceicoccus vermicola]